MKNNYNYPDHYRFKKNRLVRLGISKGKCELCGAKARHVHHLDGGKTNHDIANLLCVCVACHVKLHYRFKSKTPGYSVQYRKKYYAIHKDKYKARSKKYYKMHKKKCNAYARSWALAHPEKIIEYREKRKVRILSHGS